MRDPDASRMGPARRHRAGRHCRGALTVPSALADVGLAGLPCRGAGPDLRRCPGLLPTRLERGAGVGPVP